MDQSILTLTVESVEVQSSGSGLGFWVFGLFTVEAIPISNGNLSDLTLGTDKTTTNNRIDTTGNPIQ